MDTDKEEINNNLDADQKNMFLELYFMKEGQICSKPVTTTNKKTFSE